MALAIGRTTPEGVVGPNHLKDDSLGLCAGEAVAADDSNMEHVLRTAILVSLPGAIPLGLAVLSTILRPVPVILSHTVPRDGGLRPGTGR